MKVFAACLAVFLLSVVGVSAEGIRAISLSPSATELIFQLGKGDCLVGRSVSCDYPAEAAKIQVAGGFGTPSLERIASLRPQFVFVTALKDHAMKDGIERTGAKFVLLPSETIADYLKSVEIVGGLLDCKEAAAKEVARFRGALDVYKAEAAKTPFAARPKVYLEVWNRPLMSCGGRSFVNEMIECAGGVNIGRVQGKDYFPCSEEWILTSNPDVIICPSMGSGAAGEVLKRQGWGGISAVKAGRVYTGLKESLIFRLGPRTLEGIAVLKGCIEGKPKQ